MRAAGGTFVAAMGMQTSGLAVGAAVRSEDGIALRPSTPADAATLSRLIDDNYGSDDARISSLRDINRALHLSSDGGKQWHSTLVAESADRVVGVASGLQSPMHPAARVHVIVDAKLRRRGFGTRLYAGIVEEARAQGLQPIATIIGTEQVAWLFAVACGMRPLMHARQIRIDPRSGPLELWCRHALSSGGDFRLLSGTQVAPAVLYSALAAAYYEMHRRWIETIQPNSEQASDLWKRKIPATQATIAMQGDEVIGAAALINPGEGRATLFPASACKPVADVSSERRLVAALLADRLIAARAAGIAEVLIESDEDDGRMLEVLGAIPAFGLIEIFTLTSAETGHWPR
ncbi:MAG: GNAT family N-acetyltransferase [Pseudomonadota bacterium]|nr:GNAT family N-acetyltransferase [Pseudomonadota bacterium]